MFDRALVYRGGDTHEHITVKQQPHDAADAARLYGEIEKRAADRVNEVICHKAENGIVLAACSMNRDGLNMEMQYYLQFSINGYEQSVRLSIDEFEMFKAGKGWQAIEKHFIPKLAAVLTDLMIHQTGRAMLT